MFALRLVRILLVCAAVASSAGSVERLVAQATDVQPERPDQIEKPKKRGFTYIANPRQVVPQSSKRNHVFYVGEPVVFELGPTADRFEIRDYEGEIVDQGPATPKITSRVKQPGWYKLYLFGKPMKPAVAKAADPLDSILDGGPKKPSAEDEKQAQVRELWGDVVGSTNFVIFRNDANFPPLPDAKTSGGSTGALDQVMRGVAAIGPQRHSANADDADASIAKLERDLAIDRELYVGRDPVRPRPLMIAFGGGTKNLDGVRKIVERFQDVVEYWEPRNEPNFGASPADFVERELKAFHATVKGVNPKLKVIGPGLVSYNSTMLPWIEGFLKADGAKYIDGLSFHAYNCVNGDVWLARRALIELNELLAKYDADQLEKWQTEQGYFACIYGSFQPRLQGRWTMVQMMVYEQFGIPKEHNHLWYDRSHGFWDFPTWWENEDGSLNPAAPLMRVWSEELFGTKFQQAYDFGPSAKELYIGSLFVGPKKRVAVFQSAGSTDGRVTLRVRGASHLHISSAFGVESELSVADDRAVLPVGELPVYVRLGDGEEIEVEPAEWGENLARAQGVKVTASGKSEHPGNKPDAPPEKIIPNDIGKVVNGVLENWYRTLKRDDHPWASNVNEWPATVEIALPQPQTIARVVVFASPPWQNQSTLVDYELQVERDGKWTTVDRVQEPTKTMSIYSPPTRTRSDSYFSDRWVFQHHFEPVTTQRVRLLVHNVTFGGGATQAIPDIGGQAGFRQIVLREVELYGR